jgi:hypothetical protein
MPLLPSVLQEYASRPIFVLWKFEKTKTGRLTKPPFQPDGRYADPADPGTWITYEQALAAYQAGGFDGIGLCLLETDLVAFDLDDCFNGNGELEPAARKFLEYTRSYTEITPSRQGLRVIGRSKGPGLHRKQRVPGADGMSIETYRACPRYITITGEIFQDAPETLVSLERHADNTVAALDRANGGGLDVEENAQKEERGGESEGERADAEAPKAQPRARRKPAIDLDDVIKNGRFEYWPGGRDGKGDRSKALWYVVNELVRRDATDDEIAAICLDRGNKISEHVYDQKQKPEVFIRRQIRKARRTQPRKVANWHVDAIRGEGGQILGILANALLALREDPELRDALIFDEMLQQALLVRLPLHAAFEKPRPLTDEYVGEIQEYLQCSGMPSLGRDTMHQACAMRARHNAFHPVRNYLRGLKWDGVERLPTWTAVYLGTPTDDKHLAHYCSHVGTCS